ncbi:hypothetical protein [Chryseolinea lacunae]|uniref:SMODS-associating 2TM beta-strand rich effector domain-containing protein n=1 Tax=Chryseolinea lacunae TaxID=2801331 RepID=A0ABS1KS02_9BACT|nr:hypothetical protein [Chryseolinea lacunae]MBL0742245.1 hypothetical protein [Chryseolinea lacunae]
MRNYMWVAINLSFFVLAYIVRCLVLNFVFVFDVILIFEGIVFLYLCIAPFISRSKIKTSVIHIAGLLFLFFYGGDLVSVMALSVGHRDTIAVFRRHRAAIPEEDRVNGAWILIRKEFEITSEERTILERNYAKASPLYFSNGYCYVELGGFLKSVGGYYLTLDNTEQGKPGAFGFHRIKKTRNVIGNWWCYR